MKNNQSDPLQETLEFEQETSLDVTTTKETERLNVSNHDEQMQVKCDIIYSDSDLGWNLDETTTGINEIEKKKHIETFGYRKPRLISKQAPVSCRIEGKTFTHYQLEQILKQLYSWNNGLYSCTQCEYRTKQRWHVMVHTQKHLENFEVEKWIVLGVGRSLKVMIALELIRILLVHLEPSFVKH